VTKQSAAKQIDTREYILIQAIPQFAHEGFNGVSMRDIASTVGISAAALYHHFQDKQSLYLAAVEYSFADKEEGIQAVLSDNTTPEDRLGHFVEALCILIGNDSNFRLLLQRELLDGDESRLRVLATEIFEKQFSAVSDLAKELAPDCDAHMLALSIAGLVLHHFELGPLRRFLPGSRAEHEDPKYIARHVTRLLLHGLNQKPEPSL